jgi:hypothetical protein
MIISVFLGISIIFAMRSSLESASVASSVTDLGQVGSGSFGFDPYPDFWDQIQIQRIVITLKYMVVNF